LRWNALLISLIQYYHTVYSDPGRISPATSFNHCRGGKADTW
jgi:hypothetical protein